MNAGTALGTALGQPLWTVSETPQLRIVLTLLVAGSTVQLESLCSRHVREENMDHEQGVQLVEGVATALAKDAVPDLGLASELLRSLGSALGGSGQDRFAAAVQQEIHDATFSRLPELEAKIAGLEQSGVRVNVTDIARVMTNHGKAWRDSADEKKRKLLEDAFLRSFDKQLYESGLLNALWERLDRLSYGDLILLRDLLEVPSNDAEGRRKVMGKHEATTYDGLGVFHARNLLRESLVWSDAPPNAALPGTLRPTALGKQLRDLAFGVDQNAG